MISEKEKQILDATKSIVRLSETIKENIKIIDNKRFNEFLSNTDRVFIIEQNVREIYILFIYDINFIMKQTKRRD